MEGRASERITLGDMTRERANNFDLLRLAAALIVLFNHSFVLSGKSSATWKQFFFGYDPSAIAVCAFFVISGFLIAGSLERRSLLEYGKARALRIIPALAAITFVTALVIGPIFTTLPLSEYFSSPYTHNYFANAIPYKTAFILPGVFQNLPAAGAVNGSLWTIPIEAFCYVFLAAIFFVGSRSFKLVVPTLLLLVIYYAYDYFIAPIKSVALFGTTETSQVVRFGFSFLMGSMLWVFKDKIPFKGGIAAACIVVMLMGTNLGYAHYAVLFALPYLLLYLAYRKPIFVSGMKKIGDLSYGTYLFAFPIQQILVYVSGKSINGWWLAISASIIAMSLAWLSWRYIEKPALSLKRKPSLDSRVATAPL